MHNVGGCLFCVGSQNIVCTVCEFSLCLTLLWDVDNAANAGLASQPRTWPSPRFYLRSCALVELIG